MKKISIVILILLVIIGGFIIFNNNNNKFDEGTEKEYLKTKLDDITKSLGWITIVSSFENYNIGGEYEPIRNKNLIEKTEDKQLFVMEKILENKENEKKFVVINPNTNEEDKDLLPTEDATIAYYPYNEFNTEYKKYFNEDLKSEEAKKSGLNNSYDKDSKYVYYENKRSGANGQYVEKMTIDSITYDSQNKKNIATITITYSERQAQKLGYNSDKAEIQYKRQGENIILESLIVK